MKTNRLPIFIVALVCSYLLSGLPVLCQNSKPKNKDGFAWNGGLTGGFYFQDASASNNIAAFNYSVGANVNLSYKKLSIPLSYTYRERTGSFSSPFSRLGIAPKYKWVKLYLGHNTLNFNPYILSGMQMNGIGIELSPGKFRVAYLRGEIKNTKIIIDSLLNHSGIVNPFQRNVTAVKIGYGGQYNYFEMQMITGSDIDKLTQFQDVADAFKREANTVLGSSLGFALFKNKLSFKANTAVSAFTYNQDGPAISEEDFNDNAILRSINSLIKVNQTTGSYFAGDAQLILRLGTFNVGGKYQRIDPFYQSFGVFFMRNDVENYTLNGGLSLFRSRLNLSGSWGLNKNNLRKQRNNQTTQKVYNFQVSMNPVSFAGLDVQISNFSFNQEPLIADVDDSLKLVQVNKVNSFNPHFTFGGSVYAHNIYLNYNQQTLTDITNVAEFNNESEIKSYSFNYNLRNKVKKFTISGNFYHTNTIFSALQRSKTGAVLSFGKNLINNTLNTRLKLNYSINSQDEAESKPQYNVSLNTTYTHQKKINISVQFLYGKRPNFQLNSQLSDVRISGQINYIINH
ncbi:MAG: hypothetical protein KA341_13355 [Saprospiraceae bacterium]|nr:hypothetical protein [Saprospiraceae bacterium]